MGVLTLRSAGGSVKRFTKDHLHIIFGRRFNESLDDLRLEPTKSGYSAVKVAQKLKDLIESDKYDGSKYHHDDLEYFEGVEGATTLEIPGVVFPESHVRPSSNVYLSINDLAKRHCGTMGVSKETAENSLKKRLEELVFDTRIEDGELRVGVHNNQIQYHQDDVEAWVPVADGKVAYTKEELMAELGIISTERLDHTLGIYNAGATTLGGDTIVFYNTEDCYYINDAQMGRLRADTKGQLFVQSVGANRKGYKSPSELVSVVREAGDYRTAIKRLGERRVTLELVEYVLDKNANEAEKDDGCFKSPDGLYWMTKRNKRDLISRVIETLSDDRAYRKFQRTLEPVS